MIQQQQLFNQEKVQTRGRLRDLQGRFATPEQRDFAIRWQKLNAVENENIRLKQTNVNQERLIEGMRMRILQLSDTIRQYESEFGALPIQNHQPSTNQ